MNKGDSFGQSEVAVMFNRATSEFGNEFYARPVWILGIWRRKYFRWALHRTGAAFQTIAICLPAQCTVQMQIVRFG